jgi:hypothetical protein
MGASESAVERRITAREAMAMSPQESSTIIGFTGARQAAKASAPSAASQVERNAVRPSLKMASRMMTTMIGRMPCSKPSARGSAP